MVSRLWVELEPRNRRDASRAATALMLVAAVVTALFAMLTPPPGGVSNQAVALGVPTVLVVLAVVAFRTTGHGPSVVWAAAPVVGLLLVAALDVATADASAAGQVFFCFPMLYAASSLRPPAAYAVMVVAVVADAAVALTVLPPERAWTDIVYVGVTLIAMTVLLVRAGQQQDRLAATLRQQAAIDPLTGLVTRRVLDDAADAALASASASVGTVLILADIDHFKVINDTYGHPVGHAALVHVAGLLRDHCRPHDVLSRLGGDEIALLLPGCSPELGLERAEAITSAVWSAPLPTETGHVDLSVSVGVAHVPRDAADFRALYARADAVFYDAKRHHPGHVGRTPGPTRRPTSDESATLASLAVPA